MLKARLDVIRAISPYKSPALYRGLVDLPDRGITQVTIELPYGTERFYRVPCTVYIPTVNTFVTFPEHSDPVLIVNDWYDYD